MRVGTGQKTGGGDIREKKNHSHFFIELILDYWIKSKSELLDTYVTSLTY